jgi:hypothetical protein
MKKLRGKAKFLRGVVFELIKSNLNGKKLVGATNDEMQVVTRENSQTLSPRTRELVKAGLVCNSGIKRETRKHGWAIVWIPGAGAVINGRPNNRPRPPTKTEIVSVSKTLNYLLHDGAGIPLLDIYKKEVREFMKWVRWLASA